MSTEIMEAWIGMFGVGLGFFLGEGSRLFRHWRGIASKKKLIHAEIYSILSQIQQKKDILNQAIAHMREDRFMPLNSVHLVTTGYYAVLEVLYPHLSQVERNCLHVIYERIRVAEDVMDQFENSFVLATKDDVIPNVTATYKGRLEELLESFDVIEKLIESYISKNPVDVFYIGSQSG